MNMLTYHFILVWETPLHEVLDLDCVFHATCGRRQEPWNWDTNHWGKRYLQLRNLAEVLSIYVTSHRIVALGYIVWHSNLSPYEMTNFLKLLLAKCGHLASQVLKTDSFKESYLCFLPSGANVLL